MEIKQVFGINALCVTGTMDKAVEFFRDALGAKIGPEKPWMEKYGHRCRDAWLGTEEPFSIEISESVNDELPTGKQHKKSAPCFQFFGLEVDNLDEAIAELRAKGIRVSDKLKIDDPRFGELYEAMIHPTNTFGFIVELLESKGKRPGPGE